MNNNKIDITRSTSGNPEQATTVANDENVTNVDFGELEDIAKTCQYISQVVTNLNSNLSRVPANIKAEIDHLNTQLRGVIGGVDNSPSSVAEQFGNEAESDSQQTDRKVTGVKNKGKRHSNDTLSSSSYSQPSTKCVHAYKHESKHDRRTKISYKPRIQRRDYSSSSDSYNEGKIINSRKSRSRVKRKSCLKASDSILSAEQIAQLMSKFDNRTVPKPEQYDASSGQSFRDFLALFEEYCQHTYRGSSSLWVGELGRFLTGEMYKAFVSLKVPGDSYESIKSKLIKWRKDSHEAYDITKRSRFTNARVEPGESLRLYATRLEKTFRIAFPSHSVQKSKTLRDKFMASIPDSFRKQLYNARSISLAMNDKELTWSNILSLSSRFDTQNDAVLNLEDDSAVWVNHSLQNYNQPHFFHSHNQNPIRPHVWYSNALSQAQPTAQFNTSDFRRNKSLGRKDQAKAFGFQQRSKSAVGTASSNVVCFHCKKSGHIKAQCRRYLKLCLVCGSADHLISTCPQRRDSPSQSSVMHNRNFKTQDNKASKKTTVAAPILNMKAL